MNKLTFIILITITNVYSIEISSSTVGAEIYSLTTTKNIDKKNDSKILDQDIIEHVYSVNERETISLKCPIDLNKQFKSSNNEYDSTEANNDEIYDYSETTPESERIKRQISKKKFPIVNWYKDSSKIGKIQQFSHRYITDGIYLKIKHVGLKDSGKFKCVLVNENGNSISSNIINLIVQKLDDTNTNKTKNKKPKRLEFSSNGPAFYNSVKMQPKVFYKQKGSQVRLRCRATGSPKPNIIWYKNGGLLNEDDYGISRSKWMLDLTDLRMDDNGNFTCHVFNKFGYINQTFEVVVYEDDSQIFEGLDPLNTTIVSGMDAVFSCKVKSSTLPNIKWMKQITKAEYANYIIQQNDNIDIPNLPNSKPIESNNQMDLINSEFYSYSTKKPDLHDKNEEFLLNDLAGNDLFNLDNSQNTDLNELLNEQDMDKKNKRQISDSNGDSIHYITLSSSPTIVEKVIFNKEKNYYINQLTIKQATVKDSGIYVCFGANIKGYNYRKAHLKVLPIAESSFDIDLFKIKEMDKIQQLIIQKSSFTTKPVSTSTQFMTINGVQSIGFLIILIPVLLITSFALISIFYLKRLDNNKDRNISFIKFVQGFFCGFNNDKKKQENNSCCCWPKKRDHVLIPNNFDDDMMNRMSFKKREITKSTLASNNNTTTCENNNCGTTIGSLGAKSDSTQATTLAYYLTVPVNVPNNYNNNLMINSSILSSSTISSSSIPPPLPSSQPPTISPIKNDLSINDYVEEENNKSNLNRAESTASMAYYKIIDGDFNNLNNNLIYKLPDGSTGRIYCQLATVPQGQFLHGSNC